MIGSSHNASSSEAVRAEVAAVEARGLRLGYSGEELLSGVDLALPMGSSLALVGANGSGKSTLLKAMAGLLKPMAGNLRVLGGPPLGAPARVAYLGQAHPSGFVLPLRASEVVRMARFASHGLSGALGREDEEAVREALEAAGIADIADEPLNALSGGQRQRVFIAQALARRADLLLLDEPEANLDAGARAAVRSLFGRETARGASIVVATHDIDAASSCDQAMLLARRVVAYGPPSESLNAEALLATFGVVGRTETGRVVVVGREHSHEGCEGHDED